MVAPVSDRILAERLGVTIARVGISPMEEGIAAIQDESGLIEDWMRRNAVKAVLVRPDHIVFGSVSTIDRTVDLLTALELRMRRPFQPDAPLMNDRSAAQVGAGVSD